MKSGGIGVLAFLLVPIIVIAALFAFILLLASPAAACTVPAAAVDVTKIPTTPIDGYSGVQLQNAAAIMNAANALGLDGNAQIIGVMTAMGESGLIVLDHGDTAGPDSRGLFQQRDNGAWGTLADRMDPTISATNFFKKLMTIPNWQNLSPTIAAHDVQGNADPDFYTKFLVPASDVVAALGGQATSCVSRAVGNDYPWASSSITGISPLHYYYRQCVDFVAWRLNRDAGVTQAPWKWTDSSLTPLGGNAIEWKASWKAHGWATSKTPVAGSVAYWGTSAGPDGHVAYVQAVNPDGTVTIEEYNWGGNYSYNTRTIPTSSVDLFLYAPPNAGNS
jgi:surface antigen